MLGIVYTLLISLTIIKEPPVKIIAFKQHHSASMPKMEMNMKGESKINQNKSSYTYLIWLVTSDPKKTKIISVQINKKNFSFDTTHINQPIKIEKSIKEPLGDHNTNLFTDSTGSYIRVYLKEQDYPIENEVDTITIRFKRGRACTKKIKKTIEVLPVSITE